MKKKLFGLLLVLSLLITALPVPVQTAKAATYSVQAALDYAKAHWNDGVGMCAEFVSKCVIAGGLEGMTVKVGTTPCFNAAAAAAGLSGIELRLDANGYATYSLNSDILAAGDIVMQSCYTHGTKPHIMFCGGYDSQGRATFYGHTAAINNVAQKLNVNTAYEHTTACDMRALVVHLSALDNGQGVTYTPVSVYANRADNVSKTNATLYGSCTKSPAYTISQCGLYLGTSEGNMTKRNTEAVGSGANNKDGGTGFDIWYDLTSELGIVLSPGTTYYYKFFCISNGQEYVSGVNSFTTQQDSPAQAIQYYNNKVMVELAPGNTLQCYQYVDSTEKYRKVDPQSSIVTIYCDQYAVLPDGTKRFHWVDASGYGMWFSEAVYTVCHYYSNTLSLSVNEIQINPGETFIVDAYTNIGADGYELVDIYGLYDGSYWGDSPNHFFITMNTPGEYDLTFETLYSHLRQSVHVTVNAPATPTPTMTPIPTATPKPTATPIPTATPKPTATPVPIEDEDEDEEQPEVGDTYVIGKGIYEVTSVASRKVKYVGTTSDTATSVTIYGTVTIAGKTYKVTAIDSSAFKNNTKIKQVTIGSKVVKIGRSAFYGCKNLKTVIINSSSITSIGKYAFKGIYAKAVFKCPSAKVATYKKLLTTTTGFKSTMNIKKK